MWTLAAVVPRGAKPYVFMAGEHNDANGVYALDTSDTEADASGVVVEYRAFDGGNAAESRKRGKRWRQYGMGENARAIVTVEMDGRVETFICDGPYDANEGILFYQEFDPASVTGRSFHIRTEFTEGEGVSLEEQRFDFTAID